MLISEASRDHEKAPSFEKKENSTGVYVGEREKTAMSSSSLRFSLCLGALSLSLSERVRENRNENVSCSMRGKERDERHALDL
jgi:hypothetical protein